MKTAMKFYRTDHAVNYATKVKSLDVRLPVTDKDLGVEVRKAFDLAKSSGRELTVYFSGTTVNTDPVYPYTSEQNSGGGCYS